MFDPVTLDQLRAFVCVVEEGSFSAAARKLGRVQSAISAAMANLESQLSVTLWDRSSRVPKLTERGTAVLASARRILAEVDGLRRLTAGLTTGLEASVSLCFDAFFPLDALVELCADFAKEFPTVHLRVDTQVMSAVAARVLSGEATLGVVSPVGLAPGLERHALASIRMLPVVSPKHPLASVKGVVPTHRLADSVQIVLSERLSERLSEGVADQAVLSPRTWRVADLHTKHAMLRAGLGWGNLPEHVAAEDLANKRLVVIRPASWAPDEHVLHLSAIHKREAVLGPAHRWLVARMADLCRLHAARPAARRRGAHRKK